MQTPVHSGLRPAVLAACLLAGAPWAAHAQFPAAVPAAARTYDIPPQALGATLTRIAQESGAHISIDSTLVHGHSSPAIHGHYTAEQAAQKALAHSGLQLARTGNGTLTVRPLQGAEAALPGEGGHGTAGTALPEVTVSGKAPGSTTEGTGAYTTSSTSSSTRLNLTPQETPQAISVLTRQRLYDQHLATVADALEAAPGIVLQHTTFGQDGPAVYARGSYLQNYQIDGVPTSSTMSPFLDNTASYDRIELVRGATGIMNGLGTPAATVNLIRKRPTVAPQRAVTAELG
ncbi:MAG: TonB-dependent receptor, partial [Comamonadaceae bacterium]|nr:TonB-dependent receptor [Comamonadaceae bacterium]